MKRLAFTLLAAALAAAFGGPTRSASTPDAEGPPADVHRGVKSPGVVPR